MGSLIQTYLPKRHKKKKYPKNKNLSSTFYPEADTQQSFKMFIGKSEFYENYTTGCLLGKGGNGEVYAGYRNLDKFPVAIKVVNKKRLVHGTINQKNVRVPMEVALLHKARHIKGVAKLIEYTELSDCFVIIMERKVNNIKGQCKDLFDFITDEHKQTGHGIHEDLAKKIFEQVVQTILHLDNADILHGDIKDENILIDVKTNEVKLIDFGAGNKKFDEKLYKTYHGTRVYSPPEWIESKFYSASGLNVWSLGVLLYNLLTGDVPFKTDSAILEAQVRFPSTVTLSDSVQDLIRNCLTPSMKDRIKLQDILNHQWLSLTENNNMPNLRRDSGNGSCPEISEFRSQSQQNTRSNQISILVQPVSGSSTEEQKQKTEILSSGNGNQEKSNIQSQTGSIQISILVQPFHGSKSTTSLAIFESHIETMVVKNCHKPIFRKLVKLLMVPISFLFAGLRSGCIVGEMV